jgi:hypothetical protein
MLDPALQAGQSLLHPLFIGGGMVQGVINITDSIIQQGEDIRRGQFFPMRAESGDVAGEGMVETQQRKAVSRWAASARGSVDKFETTEASSASRL